MPNYWTPGDPKYAAPETVRALVYQTNGPPGGGPWFDTQSLAAAFIAKESRPDSEYYEGPLVDFSDAELASLRAPGDVIERNGWTITVLAVSLEEYEQEWAGW